MKKRACISFLALSLLVTLSAISASAQTGNKRLVANVPFDFQIGDMTLSAGEYTVRSISQSDSALLIRNEKSAQGRMVLTDLVLAKAGQSKHAKLVFNKYGDQYFLVSIWEGGREGRALHRSGSERRVRRELASTKSGEPEVVLIAAVTR